MDENADESSHAEESDPAANNTDSASKGIDDAPADNLDADDSDAVSKAAHDASADGLPLVEERGPPVPEAPGDVPDLGVPAVEELELLVDFGKVPLSKDRSEFDDSLYPVSVADPSQISDETSKLLHRLHYDPYDEDEVSTCFMFVTSHTTDCKLAFCRWDWSIGTVFCYSPYSFY